MEVQIFSREVPAHRWRKKYQFGPAGEHKNSLTLLTSALP